MPRTIVITGASSGIGEALALCYAREGARLGLLGRNRERLDRVAAACRSHGAEVHTASIDVRARQDIRVWLEGFDEASPVDLLIANAGVLTGTTPDGEIETAEESHALIETNVLGVLNAVHPLLPRMMSRGHGQIGLVGSLAGFVPLPDTPSYCASKSAVLTYGLALRSLLRRRGIRVSVICPGYVTTPMTQQESGWRPFEMSAGRAADLICRGLARDRPIIAFPSLLALLSRIGGVLPDRLRRWTARPFRFTVQRLADRPPDTTGSRSRTSWP
jgi:short-subunit dehydrogenase